MNRTLTLAIAALCTAAAPAAFAQYSDDNSDRYGRYESRDFTRDAYRDRGEWRDRDVARVVETRPIYEAANTKEECWNPRAGHYEEVRGNDKTRVGKGAAIGAVAGGVLGHQLGDNSRTNTAAGALLGGVLGHQLERRADRDDQTDLDRSRCRTIAEGGQSGDVKGYEVRYVYRGNEYVTRMDRDPGARLRLGRDVNSDGTPFDHVATNSVPPASQGWR